ncbi:hypothetical protein ACFV2N_48060 [Streptomyces sp. NPDC059680]|uniref:hypothetical protein n=1 Tax=Streptomyces sp. NPDC059680 TaxID=3346904 RepID=UPI003691C60F
MSNDLARIPKPLVRRPHGIHEQALPKTIDSKIISRSPTAKLTVPQRVLLATRQGAVLASTAAINQLKALIVSAPDDLRAELRKLKRPA